MRPYYQDPYVTLYHMDCYDMMQAMEAKSIDLVLTDPPYPGMKGGYKFYDRGIIDHKSEWQSISVGDPWDASYEWVNAALRIARKGFISFTSFHSMKDILNLLPPPIIIGAWHQTNAHPRGANVPSYSLQFYICIKLTVGLRWDDIPDLISKPQDYGGCISKGERIRNNNGSNAHPTQKPLSVMRSFIARGANTILDPFAGTGTTGVAAKELGRKAILIEKEERYCEIAARRLEATALSLFADLLSQTEVKYD